LQAAGAIPGKVRSGFPSGIAKKERVGAGQRFYQTLNRSSVPAFWTNSLDQFFLRLWSALFMPHFR
jgi:hypothetical protein